MLFKNHACIIPKFNGIRKYKIKLHAFKEQRQLSCKINEMFPLQIINSMIIMCSLEKTQ